MATKRKAKSADYSVGYGKPPKEHQFKPGQSGNPRGRPPKPHRLYSADQIAADFLASLEQEITVTRDGRKTTVPIIVAIYDQMALKAAKGDHRSAKLTINLLHAIIDRKEKDRLALIGTALEIDKQFSDAGAAHPHLADKIKAEQEAYRRSPEVLEAFTRVNRLMPRRGKLTLEEEIFNRTTEPPWDLSDMSNGKTKRKK